MVVLQFTNFVGYMTHAVTAFWAWRGIQEHDRAIRSGDLAEMVGEDEKRRREEKARKG